MITCKRCGKDIEFTLKNNEEFCPLCGWSRSAAEKFSIQHPIDIRNHFFKSITKAFLWLIPLIGLGWLIYSETIDIISLSQKGEQTIATIINHQRTSYSRRTGTTYYYTIQYNDYENTFRSKQSLNKGDKFYILYLPENKEIFRIGENSDTFFTIFGREFGLWGMVVFSMMAIFLSSRFYTYIRSGIKVLSEKYSFESELTKTDEE